MIQKNQKIKITVFGGAANVGRESLLSKYSDRQPNQDNDKASIIQKIVKFGNGQDEQSFNVQFGCLLLQSCVVTKNPLRYYEEAQGIIFIYDITNRASFDQCIKEINKLKNTASDNVVKLLIGNKSDLVDNRQILYKEASDIASQLGVLFYETSVQNNLNVNESLDTFLNTVKDSAKFKNALQNNQV